MVASSQVSRRFWLSRQIGAAAATDQLAVEVENIRLRGGKLRAGTDDLPAHDQIAGHGDAMVIDAHVDGRHAAAGLLDERKIRGEIDQGGENAAVGVAPFDIDHPFLAPRRLDLDAVVADGEHGEPEPLVKRRAGDQRLDLFEGDVSHGVTTTLPMTSRSWIRRKPSRACSSGSTLSITGLILPAPINSIKAARLSS